MTKKKRSQIITETIFSLAKDNNCYYPEWKYILVPSDYKSYLEAEPDYKPVVIGLASYPFRVDAFLDTIPIVFGDSHSVLFIKYVDMSHIYYAQTQ